MNPRQGKKRCFQVEALEGRIALGAVVHGVGPAPLAHVQTAATSVQTAATSLPVLKRGSSGLYVVILQADLVAIGYQLGTTGRGHNGVDGKFGRITESAVIQFQSAFNRIVKPNPPLSVDGVVGRQTWWALQETIKGKPLPRPI